MQVQTISNWSNIIKNNLIPNYQKYYQIHPLEDNYISSFREMNLLLATGLKFRVAYCKEYIGQYLDYMRTSTLLENGKIIYHEINLHSNRKDPHFKIIKDYTYFIKNGIPRCVWYLDPTKENCRYLNFRFSEETVQIKIMQPEYIINSDSFKSKSIEYCERAIKMKPSFKHKAMLENENYLRKNIQSYTIKNIESVKNLKCLKIICNLYPDQLNKMYMTHLTDLRVANYIKRQNHKINVLKTDRTDLINFLEIKYGKPKIILFQGNKYESF